MPKGVALVFGPPAKYEGAKGSREESAGEDVTGKAFAASLRRALSAESDSAILSAFKELYAHCAAEHGKEESDGEESSEGEGW